METLSGGVAELRQGDICELDLFPHWRMDTASTLTLGMANGFTHLQVPSMPKVLPAKEHPGRRLAVVCSYDCDLENPRERTAVLVAPIFALSPRHPKFAELAESGSLKTGDNDTRFFNYLQYFPLQVEEVTSVPTQFGLADFSAITSFGKAAEAVKFLMERKVSELDEATRSMFRAKLATFVGRPDFESSQDQDATQAA